MSATPAFRRKWGKYLPHQRANVDQVPLPFVNGLKETYEEVGAKRVAINGNGPALAKCGGKWGISSVAFLSRSTCYGKIP